MLLYRQKNEANREVPKKLHSIWRRPDDDSCGCKKWLWSYGTFLLSLWAESLTLVIVNKKLSLFYKSWLYRVSNCKINCGIKLHAQWLMSCYWAYGFTVRPTPSCQIFFSFSFLNKASNQPRWQQWKTSSWDFRTGLISSSHSLLGFIRYFGSLNWSSLSCVCCWCLFF